MRSSTSLFRQFSHCITIFTRSNCSLCDEAKRILSKVSNKRPFHLAEINVMQAGQEKWKSLYEFDTPVVSHQQNELLDSLSWFKREKNKKGSEQYSGTR